jgi:uncharacterized membrane protein
MKAKDFFTREDQQQIVEAIKKAEKNTSGEIRVHIENYKKKTVLDRAAYWFKKLAMHKTELRNGVLFYLAVDSRQFAILGDVGINRKVGNDFWIEVRDVMVEHFKKDEFTQGLSKGIEMTGEKLKVFFPYQTDDVNELPDEISFN